jgi:hypothetical protein
VRSDSLSRQAQTEEPAALALPDAWARISADIAVVIYRLTAA